MIKMNKIIYDNGKILYFIQCDSEPEAAQQSSNKKGEISPHWFILEPFSSVYYIY